MIRTKQPKLEKKKKSGRPRKKATDKLTPKEQEFVEIYLQKETLGLSKYQVYMKVFPRTKKIETAVYLAWELLSRPHVKHYIDQIQNKVKKKTELTLEYFIKGYKRLIEFDQRKIYKDKKLLHVTEWDDDTALATHGLDFATYQEKKKVNGKTKIRTKVYLKNIKIESRKNALDSLRDMLGFNKEQVGSPEDFVEDVRGFADNLDDAIPGGKL